MEESGLQSLPALGSNTHYRWVLLCLDCMKKLPRQRKVPFEVEVGVLFIFFAALCPAVPSD